VEEEGDDSVCRRSECEAGCGSLLVRAGGCGELLGRSKCEGGCGGPAVDDVCGELGVGEAFGELGVEEAGEEDVVPARGMWRTIFSSRFESFERVFVSRDPNPSSPELVPPARGMWWMILSKRKVSGEFGAEEAVAVDFIFSKCDGDLGVMGVAQERVRSAGRSPGVLRRDTRSQKESSLPSETLRMMASYACSVLAFLVPCIIPKRRVFSPGWAPQ